MTDISSPSTPAKSAKLRWGLFGVAVIIVLMVGGIWVYNETVFQKPLQQVLARAAKGMAHLGASRPHRLVLPPARWKWVIARSSLAVEKR